MATITEKINKDGSISFKAIVRYKGYFVTKTFPVKGSQKETTKKKAEKWALDIENQINEGTYRKEEKKPNFTVAQAIDKYIKDGNPKKSEDTRQRYISALNWFKKEIGSLPIKTLERSDLKQCRDKLKKKHKEVPIKGKPGQGKVTEEFISNSCVNRYLAYFSTFLTYCVDEYEIIKTNPMIGAKLKLKENEPRKRWLKELEERQSLLLACKNADYELYLCVLFALTTGARKSEILNLTWDNTDLENKAVYYLETKNGEDRTVPMPEILYNELREFKEQNKVRKIKKDFVFKTSDGKQKNSLIDKLYPEIIKNWQYEKITFHGLRHTYSSVGALLGINTDIIDKITGHKNGRMTFRYTHANCESLREPMNEIANFMIFGVKTSDNINIKLIMK